MARVGSCNPRIHSFYGTGRSSANRLLFFNDCILCTQTPGSIDWLRVSWALDTGQYCGTKVPRHFFDNVNIQKMYHFWYRRYFFNGFSRYFGNFLKKAQIRLFVFEKIRKPLNYDALQFQKK